GSCALWGSGLLSPLPLMVLEEGVLLLGAMYVRAHDAIISRFPSQVLTVHERTVVAGSFEPLAPAQGLNSKRATLRIVVRPAFLLSSMIIALSRVLMGAAWSRTRCLS